MANKCQATTKRGTPCKNPVADDADFCPTHSDFTKANAYDKEQARKKQAGEEQSIERGLTTGDEIPASSIAMHSSDSPFAKYEVAKRVAHTLANSNLVPDYYRGRPNDVFVAINMGAELGMEPFQAIQCIAVIDGKPAIYGDGLIGLVRGSGKVEYIKEWMSEDNMTAYCETKRKGETYPVKAQYSMADAALANIEHKKNWQKHPRRMLQMRARAYCLRDAYADVLKGLGAADELYDHENTPAAIRDYKLPETQALTADPLSDMPTTEEAGDMLLSQLEDRMIRCKSMADLLKIADEAKGLPETQAAVARMTYKKVRASLMAAGDANE